MKLSRHIKYLLSFLFACLTFAESTGEGVLSIGPEELVSTLYMERPSVAADSKGQPHFVADTGGLHYPRLMKFHRINGTWKGGVFATGSQGGRYDAGRLYIGQIEIDAKDRAWISCKFGVKEFGSMMGQGVWLFRNITTTPVEQMFRHVNVYKGMGVVSLDAKYPDQGVVLGTFGNWQKLGQYGETLGSGTLNAGHGGEKVRMRIASYAPKYRAKGDTRVYPDGIWHTAMNGGPMDSLYQNSARYKAGLGPVPWANKYTYPIMGDDFCHPGIGIDATDPTIAYISTVYHDTLFINIWDGHKMIRGVSDLKVLDNHATFEGRHGPAITPAPGAQGGAYFFWTSNSRIKGVYVSKKGVAATAFDVTAGRYAAAATDRFGNIHLVYFNNGIRYRKILVASLDPLEPQGRIGATRTPRFRWSDIKSAAYTLALTRDGQPCLSTTISANSWTPDSNLLVGAYSWRVREGDEAANKPWSRALSFVIPPDMPDPVAPSGRISDYPVAPVFEWTYADPEANRFTLQLAGETKSLGILSGNINNRSASWLNALPAGRYQWRMKSLRAQEGYAVDSEWTPWMSFQVAVPGPCALTKPAPMAAYAPGKRTVACSWTPAAGAASYTLTALFNGVPVVTATPLTDTNYPFYRAFEPGYYSLFVQPANVAGTGPASPIRTFLVPRKMSPATGSLFASPPSVFTWTRSKKAGQYLLKLSRYDATLNRYRVLKETWIPQPAQGSPMWSPGDRFFVGRYRWTVTDYTGSRQGYTSVAYFEIQALASPAP